MLQEIVVSPICIIIAVIFISGILGGVVNYLMHHFPRRWNTYRFLKSIFFGILLAAVVMFVIETCDVGALKSNQPLDYFVSGGICFLCSIVFSIVGKFSRIARLR